MKSKCLISIVSCFILVVYFDVPLLIAENISLKNPQTVIASPVTFPEAIECQVQPFYRHRPDGKPGREVILIFKGPKFLGKGTIELECSGIKEHVPMETTKGIDQFRLLLPPDAGVKSECKAKITLRSEKRAVTCSVNVPAKRQWTVYIYPHSHVDIGYTNTQANVEIIHKRNLINGIELARETAGYPEGARYLWNTEVLWPVERYLRTATSEERQVIIDAVQKGYLHLDAGYIHTNTSTSADEEFFEFFRYRDELSKLTATRVETLVQVDIPGMSWGVIPVASKLGIKYCFAMNNGSDRVGLSTEMSFKPFWWIGPDGKSKILFLQPGDYTPGAKAKGFAYWPLMAGQTDPSKLIRIVKTDHPREHFIDKYLEEKLPELEKSDYYPYDIFAMTWAMADNTPVDADLPDAVKSWNEDFAFPHLVIASATQIMSTFEQRYGDQLPVLKGDFTEYWTDGLGAAAKQTAMNRSSKERLIQTETLWTMLHPGEPAPRAEFDEAWRNVIMGTEHTWCYMDPGKQPVSGDILKVKFGFFQEAEDRSKSLLTAALSPASDGRSSVIGVFNTLSWQRSGLVTVPATQCSGFNSISDESGKEIVSQLLTTGDLVFFATGIPPLGSKKYVLKKEIHLNQGKLAKGSTLDNGIVKVVIDPQTGDISSLINSNFEYVSSKNGGSLNSYRYLHGDDPPHKASGTGNVKITILENGPLFAKTGVESEAEGCNKLVREIAVTAGQPQVEITTILDKQAILKKEGVHIGFSFNIPDPVTRVDIPWGVMELEKDQLPGANRNWLAVQRWLDISNKDRGVTWCSLDAPVFENGDITANILGGATNSPKWIRKSASNATIYSWALNNHWHTNFPLSQDGKLQFRYRILPHNSGYDAASANRFGLEQAQPLIATTIKDDFKPKSTVAIEGPPAVTLTILKTSNDGKSMKIRLRSVSSRDEKIKIVWPDRKPKSLQTTDSVENTAISVVENKIVVPAMGFITLNAVW